MHVTDDDQSQDDSVCDVGNAGLIDAGLELSGVLGGG